MLKDLTTEQKATLIRAVQLFHDITRDMLLDYKDSVGDLSDPSTIEAVEDMQRIQGILNLLR